MFMIHLKILARKGLIYARHIDRLSIMIIDKTTQKGKSMEPRRHIAKLIAIYSTHDLAVIWMCFGTQIHGTLSANMILEMIKIIIGGEESDR